MEEISVLSHYNPYCLNNELVDAMYQKEVSFGVTCPVFPFDFPEKIFEETVNLESRKISFENCKDLIKREVRAWFLMDKEDCSNRFYLPDLMTHLHIDSFLDDHDVLTPANLCDSKIMNLLKQKGNAFYRFIENHQQIPSISLHLGFSTEKIKKKHDILTGKLRDEHFMACSDMLDKNEVLERIILSLNSFRNNLKSIGYSGDLLLEIMNFSPSESAYSYITEPQFIKSVINETGFGLVFDTAHILINAMNSSYKNGFDYIRSLLDTINISSEMREIHVSTPAINGGQWFNRHLSIYKMKDRPECRFVMHILSMLLQAKYKNSETTPLYINFETPLKTWIDDFAMVIEQIEKNQILKMYDLCCHE